MRNLLLCRILFLFFSFIGIFPLYGYQYQLSICTIFQNEARFLQEWIDHHRRVGVEHFWLYNNNSTDDYKTELKPYIDAGVVELIEWPSIQKENDFHQHCFVIQIGAFSDALNRCKKKSKWLAAIDTDEFLVPVSAKTVPEVLENIQFRKAPGVYINWVMYGTSGIETTPKGELTSLLLYRAQTDCGFHNFCKSIIQTSYGKKYSNPHFCSLNKKGYYVDGDGKPVNVYHPSGVHIEHLRINHYWCRDRQFMNEVKIPRQKKWGNNAEAIINTEKVMNDVFDPIILQFRN